MRKKKQSVVTNQVESEMEDINEEVDWGDDLDLSDDLDIDIEDPEELSLVDEDLDVSEDSDLDGYDVQTPVKIDDRMESNSDTIVKAKDDGVLEKMEEAEFNIDHLIPCVTKTVTRIPEAGVMSVVNSAKNGSRTIISQQVHNNLQEPSSVQAGFIEDGMVLGAYLGDEYTPFNLRKQGAKQVIYNKGLVEQITNHFGLDFSNRTSITFHSISYKKLNGQTIAIISL